jgi:hypothetical protein
MTYYEKTFPLSFGGKILLCIDKGKVKVWGWENASCKLEVSGENLDVNYKTREDELEIELEGREKTVTLYLPKECKFAIEGSYVDGHLVNLEGKIFVDIGKGNFKFSNIKGDGEIDIEKGELELENIQGKWFIDNGIGNITGFSLNGEINIENGKGNIELIRLNGECDLENGKGKVKFKDSGGNLNLYNGVGDLTLDNCNFKRLAAEGKGNTEIVIPSNFHGVWRIFNTGDFHLSIPVIAQLNFKIESSYLDNKLPCLNLMKNGDFYEGNLGNKGRGSLYIEGAKNVSITKGNSNLILDSEWSGYNEETLRILQMLKDGIITLEQANELLETIQNSGGEIYE